MKMDRKKFIKNSLLGMAALASVKTELTAKNTSTYEQLMEPIGFNHLPLTKKMKMNYIIHRQETRGHADHGWLDSHHSFSFAGYYNPERIHFGVLRVLNDDVVAPGMGFPTHPHDNMEIISIPLEGDLEHKDSMGNTAVIREGDIQVMSAGTGIKHSEYNKNSDRLVKFLQIWLFPHTKNVQPRYDQIQINTTSDQFNQILSPNPADEGVWIHQDAWFHIGTFTKENKLAYKLKKEGNGVYAFILEGEAKIEGQHLKRRDGMGIWEVEAIQIEPEKDSKIVLMEVPMKIKND